MNQFIKNNNVIKNFLLISFLSILISCSETKDYRPDLEIQYIDISLIGNSYDPLTVLLSTSFATEGSVNITKQANNYLISELIFAKSGLIDRYKPKEDFRTDYVEITQLSTIGDNINNQKIIFRINIATELKE